jgi:hypothetical protein
MPLGWAVLRHVRAFGPPSMAPAAHHDADASLPEEGAVGEPGSTGEGPIPVSKQELNAWRRGFTPQAEIWNGRLAMVGLSVGLTVLLIARLASTHS